MEHELRDGRLISIRHIRRKEWEDATNLIFEVFLQFEAEAYGEQGTREFKEFLEDKRLKRMFYTGNYLVLGAFLEDRLIGVISLRNGNHISLLFVKKDYHRKGVAAALMQELIDHLRRTTREENITVHSSPYAIGFYHRLGFRDTDVQQMDGSIIYTPMIKYI